jgi:hypothetical protein
MATCDPCTDTNVDLNLVVALKGSQAEALRALMCFPKVPEEEEKSRVIRTDAHHLGKLS